MVDMVKIEYICKRFRKATLEVIEQANEIITTYIDMGLT